MADFRIKTPHAAILVWNYVDRIVASKGGPRDSGVKNLESVEKSGPVPVIISTLSCISIQTNKTKGSPDGTFQLVLAPFKNWVSNLTAGSWCCILMSTEPISETDITKKANKKHVKMIGKIESVRCDTQVAEDGTRKTLYYVSGIDWGHIFNSTLYVDSLLASKNDPENQGNSAAVALRNALFVNGSPKSFAVKDNLHSILGIFGKKLGGFSDAGAETNRLANSIYSFNIPQAMVDYFDFRDANNKKVTSKKINDFLTLRTGSLISKNKYKDTQEARGYINPFSLQGTHSVWQILLENSNPALNEMFCDLSWNDGDNGLNLTLYNRIRPFSFKGFSMAAGVTGGLRSYFQNVKRHVLDAPSIVSVNAGTNWRDKFNFVEIKPQFQDFVVIANWYKQKSQVFDAKAFEREGFRPLIFDTKQFPSAKTSVGASDGTDIDWSQLEVWAKLLREWYFDTHRMLNGTIVVQGIDGYIGVGDNIQFDAGLINPTPNMNSGAVKKHDAGNILAHVESISHNFTVSDDGARSFRTTINFVRGIVVNNNGELLGDGLMDQSASATTQSQDRNTNNVISTSGTQDPDPQKVKGK